MYPAKSYLLREDYSSGLVLVRPVTRSPSFHVPRFSSNATRSNRLRTFLLFFPDEDPALKLGCCDIVNSFDEKQWNQAICGSSARIFRKNYVLLTQSR
jgi:hypothetical protein